MKGIGYRVSKGITIGTMLFCDDNSGARVLKVIGVEGYRSRKNRYPRAGVGDIVIVSVKEGSPKVRKKVERAVIIRQKKPYRRANGMFVKFEDNAAILINEKNEPKGSEIKGVVAKEVAIRFPRIPTISKGVV